ncbi:type VI secretion system tube protein Hcp [Tatumella morbirosei]|uniref:type VI secretion system tube protein Hcp n=1 Tax=Tatumella morbirosei TaxID=642227 RepID=UPI00069BAAE2|nr:type VI secretion system tube protein Hcp [Tatumella morbirosei]
MAIRLIQRPSDKIAVAVYLFLTDDGGPVIRGSSDVHHREGSMEFTALHYGLTLPVGPMTGKITGPRQHSPFQLTKHPDSASPYLF